MKCMNSTFKGCTDGTRCSKRLRGITLVECMLAITILAVVSLSLTYSSTAGHHHLSEASQRLTALHLADWLMDEIVAKRSQEDGNSRTTYGVADFQGFTENIGELQTPAGALYSDELQKYRREVSTPTETLTIPSLANVDLNGRVINITVSDDQGNSWQIQRYVAEVELP